MRTASRFAPALPPLPRTERAGVAARLFAAWRAGWIAHAAVMVRAAQARPRLPWPVEGDYRLGVGPQCCS